jgi:hypothetical protein
MTTFTKVQRGIWKLEGATHYAVVQHAADFADQRWQVGWHVRIRDSHTGLVSRTGGCFKTRKEAEAKARTLID